MTEYWTATQATQVSVPPYTEKGKDPQWEARSKLCYVCLLDEMYQDYLDIAKEVQNPGPHCEPNEYHFCA